MRLFAWRFSGLALAEALVVVAILLVLAGLLLPAVYRVREASNRAECINHLKQIGMAMNSYHHIRGAYPRGGSSDPPDRLADPYRREQWSWAYWILPFLDEEPLFHQSDPEVIDRRPVKVYYCPTRRAPTAYGTTARLGYAGNAGTDPNGLNGVIVRSDYLDRTGETPRLVTFPSVRLTMLTDGAARTVLVGEKQLNRARLGVEAGDDAPYTRAGWADDFEVYRVAGLHGQLYPPAPDTCDPKNNTASPRFGSAHRGSSHFVFCDGSARPVHYAINPEIFRRICTRNDNLPVNLDDL